MLKAAPDKIENIGLAKVYIIAQKTEQQVPLPLQWLFSNLRAQLMQLQVAVVCGLPVLLASRVGRISSLYMRLEVY